MDDTEKISIILRQTDFTEEQAQHYLDLYNGDCSKVIRHYLVGDKVEGVELNEQDKKEKEKNSKISVKSLNQEIYKQFRQKLEISEDKKRG